MRLEREIPREFAKAGSNEWVNGGTVELVLLINWRECLRDSAVRDIITSGHAHEVVCRDVVA